MTYDHLAGSTAKERPLELTLLRAANALRITPGSVSPPPDAARSLDLHAIIDVSTGGRLAGVELRFPSADATAAMMMRHWTADPSTSPYVNVHGSDSAYIELSTIDDDALRSADAVVTAELADGAVVAITIPRSGHGYEITYPSGNR